MKKLINRAKNAAMVLLCGTTLCTKFSISAIENGDSTVVSQYIIQNKIPTNDKNAKFKLKQLILPASLISLGTFGVYNHCFGKLNSSIKEEMDKLRESHYFKADDYIQYLPAISYLGLDFLGIKAKHSFKERFIVEVTAYLSMTTIVNITKYTVKEPRPDTQARNSFPSGHTATVFTGAELVREEYGLGIGIGAYAVATGVAFLRLYNNRHWVNDVIAGAGIGILSARIGYWMLPLYQKWFKWDKLPSNRIFAITPVYNREYRSLSVNMIVAF